MFKIRANLVTTIGLYFVLVLVTQIAYGLINLKYTSISNERRNIDTVKEYLDQASLNIGLDLDRLERMSIMVYDESYFYFKQKDEAITIESANSELNTIVDIIFKMNEDISGVSIYRPKGGMITYVNPYSPYFYLSNNQSQFDTLLASRKDGDRLLRTEGDNLSQSLLSIKYYQPDADLEEYAIIALEKHWGQTGEYFDKLGLLDIGSIILTNQSGDIIMSFRKKNSLGDDEIIRNRMLEGQITETTGTLQLDALGQEKYVFYNKNTGHGCTLYYITSSDVFSDHPQNIYYVILSSSVVLVLLNILMAYLFIRHVYRPITNAENALHAIVSGDTDLKLHNTQTGNELAPMYNDLNSLTLRLTELIESEYSAGVMKKQAEIDALQSQINPHFLYNTLESIRGEAIDEGVVNIAKMVKALADIFRYSITNKNEMVTLEEEIKNIDNYLKIQQYRFNNKFVVVKEIEEEAKKCLIPKLIIQPLVENAIIHGLELKPSKGTIRIAARLITDSLVINIEDDGLGIDKEMLDRINHRLATGTDMYEGEPLTVGLGMVNINERVKLIFNAEYGLKLYSMRGIGTNAELTIPKIIK